jgi:hypothetical protein
MCRFSHCPHCYKATVSKIATPRLDQLSDVYAGEAHALNDRQPGGCFFMVKRFPNKNLSVAPV